MTATKKRENYPGKRAKTSIFKKKRFLEEFAKCANLSTAAKIAGVDRNIHYKWLEDPEYVAAFDIAHKEACDAIDQEIYRRGAKGFLEPVFYQGKKVSDVRRYDSTLLIFFAKGLMPDKYRENFKGDINLKADVTANHNLDLTRLTNEQLEALDALYTAAVAADGRAAESIPERTVEGKAEETAEPDSGLLPE